MINLVEIDIDSNLLTNSWIINVINDDKLLVIFNQIGLIDSLMINSVELDIDSNLLTYSWIINAIKNYNKSKK